MSNVVTKLEQPRRTILGALAERYGMDAKAFELTLRKTVMPNPHSDEEFAACCLVAHEHNLNPITREIYFMRGKDNIIRPIVGVDGWIRKCNEHPAFNGVTFEDIREGGKLAAIKCIIFRKDRDKPVDVTEYLAECKRETANWKQMPSRMLRHRALIQCTRVAIGFAGVMDPDEFEQWQERYRAETARDVTPAKQALLEIPDIPDGTEVPTEAEASQDPPFDKTSATETDAEFISKLDAAYALAKDLDALNEVMLHNETAIEERGLEQEAADIYQEHKSRIYESL